MYNSLHSSHDRIYNFEELAFPSEGVKFEIDGLTATRPYIAFNMVSSADGKATTYKGKITGLGSLPDRLLMKRLRSQFDGVLAGGTTLRQDQFIPTVPPELLEERQKNFSQPQPFGIVLSEQLGIKRLLVEGGPALNYSLISQGLADELFLTLSPYIVGGLDNMTVVGGANYGMGGSDLPKLKLRSLYQNESELFLRYQFDL